MSKMKDMLSGYIIPPVAKVKQTFDSTRLDQPEQYLAEKLRTAAPRIAKGQRIAITAGSRGIAGYLPLLRTIVAFVRSCEAEPFIVPSMGSHGGATAEGQIELLRHLGITEQSAGAPILSSMEVVEIGITDAGLPAFVDKNVFEADGIILFNRIKSHTSIRAEYESGLMKMLSIGLAKHKGAAMTHALGVLNLGQNVVRVGALALDKLNIVCGVGTIENGYNELADIYVLDKKEIMEQEPSILTRAKSMIPHILLESVDALIVVNQGKDISGTGMDPAVIGRPINRRPNDGTHVEALGVLRLTEASAGNGTGCGMADFIALGLRRAMTEEYMQVNATTGMIPLLAKIPITLESEKLVFQACMRYSSVINPDRLKLVIIEDTKHLKHVYMSKAALGSAGPEVLLERCSEFMEVPFDQHGVLTLL